MKKLKIPEETIERLPLYLRRSEELASAGEDSVTSNQFVRKLPGISSENLRKDLSYFGNYGIKGHGYDIPQLLEELENILKIRAATEVALVGVGNLGTALLTHGEFNRWGFKITVAFDSNPELIGDKVGGVEIRSVQDLVPVIQNEDIEVAMLTVPSGNAQSVANTLVSAGVRGVLNFAPTLLDVPQQVKVMQLDITSKLKELNYYLEK